MDRLTAAAPSSRVTRIEPQRVAALFNLGFLPAIPDRVEASKKYERHALPPGTVESILWFVVGDPFAPKGVMGVQPRFNLAYCRWSLEIQEIRGGPFAVRSLVRYARDMAREMGYVLTGEIDVNNGEMIRMISLVFGTKGRGAEIDRVRFSEDFS